MNWGYKILFVYAAFVLMIVGMVYVSSKQTNEMQEENYYVKELKYQDVINGKNNLNALPGRTSITGSVSELKIKIPPGAAANITNGKISLLCPSDKKKDISFPLEV